MLLHSERCLTYDAFRDEVDTIAKARASNLLIPMDMDLGVFGSNTGKGRGKGPPTKCDNCGKLGHMAKNCWGAAGSKAKGKGKGGASKCGKCGKGNHATADCWAGGKGNTEQSKRECLKCGMTNHIAKGCRASEAKIKKHRETKKKDGVHHLNTDQDQEQGMSFLCRLGGGGKPREELRTDRTARSITFRIDTGACATVVPKDHQATRGYRIWSDAKTGRDYNTAGASKVKDEGRRVLQTKAGGGPQGTPRRLETRAARVSQALMAVVDMVDRGQVVVFDSTRSFAYHKQTGVETEFVRREGGWDLTLDLEAPEIANKVAQDYLAQMTTEKLDREKAVTVVVQQNLQEQERSAPRATPTGPFGRR